MVWRHAVGECFCGWPPFLAASVDRDLARLRACTELRQRPLPQAPSSLLLVCPAAASMVALHGHLLVALVACFHGVVVALGLAGAKTEACGLRALLVGGLVRVLAASKDRDLRAPSLLCLILLCLELVVLRAKTETFTAPSSWSRCGYPGFGDIHLLPPSVSWQATAPKQAVGVWCVQCALAPALGGRGCMTLRLVDGGACAPGGREHSSLGSTTSSSRSTVRAFVTLDGRALCSCDTSLLRSEIQRPSGPRGEGRGQHLASAA